MSPTARPTATPTTTPTATSAAAECPATPLDVTITYDLVATAGGGVIINAESNLPEGAELGASFFIEGEFLAQDDGVLKDGKVVFGPFSNKSTPLRGTYDMSITLPIARLQPHSVQECIGTGGELMTGPLVSTEEISGDHVASINVPVTFE
jgi:hypothetical protein